MLMSKAEYARHRGVSRQTVYDWVAKGEVVLSGNKIDVEATERKSKNSATTAQRHDQDKKVNISPRAVLYSKYEDLSGVKNQPFAVSAQEAADMVLTLDDIYPPAETEDELRERVQDAAGALGLEVRTLDIEGDEEHIRGIELYDPEQDKIVMCFESYLFELEALTFLRWLIITKRLGDTDLKSVTKVGLAALSEPFVSSAQDVYADRFESGDDEV